MLLNIPETTATQKPAITRSATGEVTSVLTTYSIIRIATQSPVSALIPQLGILGAWMMQMA